MQKSPLPGFLFPFHDFFIMGNVNYARGNAKLIRDQLKRYEGLLHELQLRDRIKSAEHHFAADFAFDGFFEPAILQELFFKIILLSKEFEFSTFGLGVSWPLGIDEGEKIHLKRAVQTPLIEKISGELKKQAEFNSPDIKFLIDFNKKLVLLRIKPVYIFGRYCKFSREIAQTEYFCNKCRGKGCWYCRGTGHFSEESVEQLLGKIIVPHFDSKLLILHGAGREDMDVLMLGMGRPFIAELLMPKKRFAHLADVENEINSKFKGLVCVNSMKMCSANDVSLLKNSHHEKIYAALVHADNNINYSSILLNQKINVLQSTPTRVANRRADLAREKEVTILRVGEISKQEFVLILRTSHGTYVKEFISGDNGRTSPSISSITGAHCECMLLDVIEVCE